MKLGLIAFSSLAFLVGCAAFTPRPSVIPEPEVGMTQGRVESLMSSAVPPAYVISSLSLSSGTHQVTYKQSPPGLMDIYFNVTYDRNGTVVDVSRMQF